MSGKNNLSEVLAQVMRNRMAELHVSMPAQIVDYDFATQKASVQPLISRKYTDGRVDAYPVINNVPVVWPRSGGASLTMPVDAGDYCILVFADRSIDGWTASGGAQPQDDRRLHSLNDAVAFMGMMPFSEPSLAENNDDVLMTYDQNSIRLKPGGNSEVESSETITLRCGGSTIVMTPTGITMVADRIDLNP